MVEQTVFLVDDDDGVRKALTFALRLEGFSVRSFRSARAFLENDQDKCGCLITDVRMPDIDGMQLQRIVAQQKLPLSVFIMTGHGDVPMAVETMLAGAVDFLEKPFDDEKMLASVRRALDIGSKARSRNAEAKAAKTLLESLTPRERGVLDKLVQGRSNKVVAYELGISPRTVEIHRAHIMGKMDATSLSDLVRVVLAAEQGSNGHA